MAIIQIVPAGDLKLEKGSFVVATGLEYQRQKLASRFKFFLGEWFLNKREGVPYFRDVFVKNPNLDVIRAIFRRVALSVPGALSVPRFQVRFDPGTRQLSYDFAVVFAEGVVVVSPEDDDFIVTVG